MRILRSNANETVLPTAVTLYAIWRDTGGGHEPPLLMSLWTQKVTAEAEIARLQQEVYIYCDPETPQRFWVSIVIVDQVRNGGWDNAGGEAHPPF